MKTPTRRTLIGLVIWTIIALLVLTTVLLIVLRPKPEDAAAAPEAARAIRAQRIEPQTFIEQVSLPVRLAARQSALPAAEQPGAVRERLIERGDTVAAGAPLYRLDDRLWRNILAQAELELREATRDAVRWEDLRRAGAVTESDYDAVQTRREQAELAVADARLRVERCTIQAPFDALVEDYFVEPGEFLAEGAAVARLVAPRPLLVRLDVPEREVMALTVGAPLHFTLDAMPGGEWNATVTFIATAADPAAHTYRVEALVTDTDDALRPGLVGQARIVRREWPEALVAPLAAIVPFKGEHVAYIVQGERAIRRTVRLARLSGDEALIADGLEPGDLLVVEGQRALSDGALVSLPPDPSTQTTTP
ncbi:MAG: efflux RND transporter periplasmic adaptor subunit [Candidatus Marinimicrobia bacterium]|nr:efflux RND transporter periplasmic adaptor subunit [Candidatus Neomarinimicrobiota bacterium]